jgi:hypothetical protein
MSKLSVNAYKTLDQEIIEAFKKRNIDIKLTVTAKNGKGQWVIEQVK